MENSEKIKIIQYHNNLLGLDCPCQLRATGKFKIHDHSRMPKDEAELEEWRVEMVADKQLKDQKITLLYLIAGNEYHLISRRFAGDVPAWEKKLDEWAAQLKEVQAGKLVEIAEKPVF